RGSGRRGRRRGLIPARRGGAGAGRRTRVRGRAGRALMPPRRLSGPPRFPGLGLAPCEVRRLLRDGHRAGDRANGCGGGLPEPADPDGAVRAIISGGVPIFGPLLAAAETAGRLRLLVLTDRRLLTVRRAARARRAVAEQEVPLGEARVGVERLGRASGR